MTIVKHDNSEQMKNKFNDMLIKGGDMHHCTAKLIYGEIQGTTENFVIAIICYMLKTTL